MPESRTASTHWRYQSIHIDVARFATDDFNPFHDSRKWQRIRGNPFGAPIVLGFQLECLAEYLVARQRATEVAGDRRAAPFRNYRFAFVDVLRANEPVEAFIRPTVSGQAADGTTVTTNRVVFRRGGRPVFMGSVRDSSVPLSPAPWPSTAGELPGGAAALTAPDRHLVGEEGTWFHKHKYLMAGNAKNLLAASLAEPSWYFDELEDRVSFPDMAPVSFISCALLERAHAEHYDFYNRPLVYTAHEISVAQDAARALRSNDRVHILVDRGVDVRGGKGLAAGRDLRQRRHRCLGVLDDATMLFSAEVLMAPLDAVIPA